MQQDEREGGVRATLNLGHTFGHAIETWQNYTGRGEGGLMRGWFWMGVGIVLVFIGIVGGFGVPSQGVYL